MNVPSHRTEAAEPLEGRAPLEAEDEWMTCHHVPYSCRAVLLGYEYEYGNMVDFSFIVSLYVSDLPNVYLVRIIYVYFIFINFKKLMVNFCRHFSVFWGMFEIY